jgi:hypothetical protein
MAATAAKGAQTVEVPLPDYVRQIAREAGREGAMLVVEEHVKTCPMVGFRARLYGFALGLSAVGGLIGWFLGRVMK